MKKPFTLEEFINIISDEWQRDGRDMSDIGNIIGIKLAEKDLEEANNFLHGVKHGISLIDGTHSIRRCWKCNTKYKGLNCPKCGSN